MMDKHITPSFENHKLNNITTADIDFFTHEKLHTSNDISGLSAKTVRDILTLFKSIPFLPKNMDIATKPQFLRCLVKKKVL